MPEIEQNGPNFKYIVSYKRRDIDNAREYSYTVERPEEFHYVVPDPQPTYAPFDITVKAKNSMGDARQAVKTIIGWSGEDGKKPVVRYQLLCKVSNFKLMCLLCITV